MNHHSNPNKQTNKKQRLILKTVYQNNPTLNLKVEQAIAMARNNESLEGLVIEDLQHTQVIKTSTQSK